MAASTGCTRNAVGSSAWQRTLTSDIHGAREQQAPWMADHIQGKSKSDLTSWSGSFLLLPGRHALSSRWLWTFNHNTCDNRLEEVQGAATSSRHLSFKTCGRVYSSCVQSAMLHASETWPLTKLNHQHLQRNEGHWSDRSACLQQNDRTMIRQISNVRPQDVTTRSNEVVWHWGSVPHSEGEKAPLVWTFGTLQWCSQDSLSHTGWGKAWAWEAQNDMEAADRDGLQRIEALSYQPSW